MIRLKKSSGLLILLVILGVFVGLVNRSSLPVWKARTQPAKPTIQPLKNTKQPVPQQFNVANGEGNDEDYSSLTTEAIWKNLLTGFREGKNAQIGLEDALIERLQKEPDSPIYKELLSLFRQGGLQGFAQQVLVSILGEVGNYPSAETLIRLVNDGLLYEADVKLTAAHAISKFTPELWHGHPNTEFAPLFEAAWQTDDSAYWSAIADVMASIGTSSTLDIFNETLQDNVNPERVKIVKQAMTNLVNPALVPKLADTLEDASSENVQLASGNALAHMGELKAATALYDWSKQVDAGKVGLVTNWFETAMNTTPGFVGYLEKNLPDQNFAAPEIKQAITSVLKELKNDVE